MESKTAHDSLVCPSRAMVPSSLADSDLIPAVKPAVSSQECQLSVLKQGLCCAVGAGDCAT